MQHPKSWSNDNSFHNWCVRLHKTYTAPNLLYYSSWNVRNRIVGWHWQIDLILTMEWQFQNEEDPVLNKFPLQIPFTIDMCGCIKHDTTLNLLYYSCWNVWNTTVGWHRQKDLILTMEWQYQKEEDPVLFSPVQIPFTIDMYGNIRHDTTLNFYKHKVETFETGWLVGIGR
jgi:hypothetical protein